MNCQVIEKRDEWPYFFPCKDQATHVLSIDVRRKYPEIVEEYICEKHASLAADAFGLFTVDRIKDE